MGFLTPPLVFLCIKVCLQAIAPLASECKWMMLSNHVWESVSSAWLLSCYSKVIQDKWPTGASQQHKPLASTMCVSCVCEPQTYEEQMDTHTATGSLSLSSGQEPLVLWYTD